MSSHHTAVQDGNPITADEAEFLVELNQRESLLLRLPRELRNIIYGYALGGNLITYRPHLPSFGPGMPPQGNFEVWVPDRWANTFYGPMPMSTLLSLQSSSRQLHAEIGNKLIFAINTFDVTGLFGWNLLLALPWFGLRAVKTIRLIIPPGPVLAVGFYLQVPLRFNVLWGLTSLRTIEAAYQMHDLGVYTQKLWALRDAIQQNTGLTAKIVPFFSERCKSDTPLESAMQHGREKED